MDFPEVIYFRSRWADWCGSMLVTEPNLVWLLVTVLVVAVVFVTSDCLLCQILPCPRCVWKIHWGGWHNSAGSSSNGQVIWVTTLSSNSKNRENLLYNNKKSFLLKHVCETINIKTNDVCFFGKKEEERILREGGWRWGAVRVTLMSLKSGTSNFCNIWGLFGVPRV